MDQGFDQQVKMAGIHANVLILVGLLVLPAIALQRWVTDWLWIGAFALAINGVAYGAYALDKRRAWVGPCSDSFFPPRWKSFTIAG